MMQPRFIILKEGTDTSQGRGQLISNINACEAVCEILKTTLGPLGMDKLIHDANGRVTISNDGATIIKLLDIVHPAARTLVDIARAQDDEVGDGTTSVCLLAGELLKNVKGLIEDGVHPSIIISGFRQASTFCLSSLRSIAIDINNQDPVARKNMLTRCASTALNSKLISGYKDFFAHMAVDAVLNLVNDEAQSASSSSSSSSQANSNSSSSINNYVPTIDINLIGIKQVPGGSVTDSILVDGVAFKKTFAYAGFEQQPKSFKSPLIVLLNVELELKSERANAEIRIKKPEEYQSIVDAEWSIIYDKLKRIVDSGAKIVLSRLPIGDLATQYFADRDIFCAGRVPESDLNRVALASGGTIQTSLGDLNRGVLGTCASFEERQIGSSRFNLFTGCAKKKTSTLILRGGADQFIAETERSLHDALMIVKRALENHSVVGGGGAIEMELSKLLRHHGRSIQSKVQLVVTSFAKSLEIIPRQLCENAGFDATQILNQLRAKHATLPNGEGRWYGVDIENEGVVDTVASFVWEPQLVKANAIAAATEAACCILSVDETVKSEQSEGLNDNRPPPMPGQV